MSLLPVRDGWSIDPTDQASAAGDDPLLRWRRIGGRRGLWVMAITAMYAVVLLLRRPSALAAPTIWAEDGAVFIAGSFLPWGDIFSPYAGQLWVLQRLVASVLGQFPATWWPALLYVVSCLGAALAIAVVLSERARPLLGRFRFRVLAGTILVLLPGVWEAQGNLANLHWWAMVAAMLLLAMSAPNSSVGRVAELAVIGTIAFTGLGGVLLLPVALWRVLVDHERYVIVRSGIIASAAALQVLLTFALTDRGDNTDPMSAVPTLAEFLIKRVGGGFLMGERLMSTWWIEGPVSMALAALSVVLLGIVAVLVIVDLRGPSWAWLGTGVLCVSLAILAMPAEARAMSLSPYFGGRYVLLMLAGIVLIVVRALAGGGRPRWVAAGALILMVGGVVGDAVLPPLAEGIPKQDLVQMQACLDGEPEFADAPFCFVSIQPLTDDWRIVVER